MLPKPDKASKKSSKNPEQLDLVQTLDNHTKVASKRRTVIFLLVATIGLSISFSVYRLIQRIITTRDYPKITVPSVNINTSQILTRDSLDAQISKIIKDYPWSISVSSHSGVSSQEVYSYSSSSFQSDPLSLIPQLSKSQNLPDSPIVSVLPQGIEYHENVIASADFSEHQLLIVLPNKKQLLFLTRLSSPDTDLFRSSLPQIIDHLYWYSVKKLE